MDDVLSVEKLQLFFAFVVPGIITLYCRAQFLTGRMPPVSEALTSYLAISLLYHALAFGIVFDGTDKLFVYGMGRWGWFCFVFLIPAFVGSLSGLNIRHGWTAAILTKARASTVHPIECAWDWRFSDCQESWVLVTLKDDIVWAGVLGARSFISSNPSERDIYLERVYNVDGANKWTEKLSSVWISQSDIQSIEMWPKM